MPQAVSPRYRTVSPYGVTPDLPKDRRPQAPKLKARVNPRDWSPERVARYYQKHGSPAKSPIMAKIVLDKKLDGHALIDTPEDILYHLVEEYPELQEEMRATASELRSKAGHVSPSSRLPRAQDIALALAQQSETPVPSLSASPEITLDEQPPSPRTPPEWDLDEDSETDQQHAEGSMPPWLRFASPSSVPQLLRPLVAVSPGPYGMFELSALDVLDPQRAADFASADPAEVVESDIDAVDSGDHPDLQQPHDDLPGRQDGLLERREREGEATPQADVGDRPRSRPFQLTARRASRARSCPPNNSLSIYIPPLPSLSLSTTKTYTSISIQVSVDLLDRDTQAQDDESESLRCEADTQTDEAEILGDLCQVDEVSGTAKQDHDSEEADALVDLMDPIEPKQSTDDHSTLSGTAIDPLKATKPLEISSAVFDGVSPATDVLVSTQDLIDISSHGEPTSHLSGERDLQEPVPEPRGDENTSEAQNLNGNPDVNVASPSPPPKDRKGEEHDTSQLDAEAEGARTTPVVHHTLLFAHHDDNEVSGESSDDWQSFKSPDLSAASNPTTPVPTTLALIPTTPRASRTDIEEAMEDALEDNIPLARLSQFTNRPASSHITASSQTAQLAESDIEGGFTVVNTKDAAHPASQWDVVRNTKRTKPSRRDSQDGWQSVSGEESEDSEAAWNLSDQAEKGLVEHTSPTSDPEKALLQPAHTFPARLVTESLQVMMPKPEHNRSSLSLSLSRSRDSEKEESKGAWALFSKVIGFGSSPSSSPVPPTPSDETDSEALFQEATDAEVAAMSKSDREKYKKKLKKKRQRMERKASDARVDALYS